MRLATFTLEGSTRIGVVRGDSIIDLSVAAPGLPTDMAAFLEAGELALAAVTVFVMSFNVPPEEE